VALDKFQLLSIVRRHAIKGKELLLAAENFSFTSRRERGES